MGKKNIILKQQKHIILYQNKNTNKDLENLKKGYPIWNILNLYTPQLKELFEITHPHLRQSPEYKNRLQKFIRKRQEVKNKLQGDWVYFPWNGYLVHMVTEQEYNLIRTNRNRNLITIKEQERLMQFCVGIVGLSIGNSIAVGLAYNGIANKMKLAEYDVLETSNLNRIRASISDIGKTKTVTTAEQIYEINPYAKLQIFSQGLKKQNLQEFLNAPNKPQIVFDAIDDFELKVRLRLAAKKAQVPIIMLTNLGDNVLVDVERYDEDHNSPLFNGLIGRAAEDIFQKPMSEEEKIKYAVQIVGIGHVPTRALKSIFEINETLVGRPQLASTVTVAGGLASYLVRKIALGESLPSGRRYISFAKMFNLEQESKKELGQRKILMEKFDRTFSL